MIFARTPGLASAKALREAGARLVLHAGRSGAHADTFRAASVDGFIPDGCNALAILAGALDLTGRKHGR